jgi:hypothetical protein
VNDRYRPLSAFAAAFAQEYKGFMTANNISNVAVAARLGRNDGYVSERANGKRPLDTEDIDALAMSVPGWTGKTLMIELARRTRVSMQEAEGELIRAEFGSNVGGASEDEPEVKQPPARQRTAARKGTRKADQAPHAD